MVIVNLTTYQAPKEKFCLIEAGEHPFVKHTTCVAYNYARIVPLARLEQRLQQGMIALREPVSAGRLARIRQGVSLSGLMPLDCVGVMASQRLT